MAQEPAPIAFADLTDDEILKELGMRLHVLRRRRGYGLQEVAEKTGIGVSTLSRYENGRADFPSIPRLLRLLEFYGSTPAWLFSDLGDMRVFPNGESPLFELLDGKGAGQGPIQRSLFVGIADLD